MDILNPSSNNKLDDRILDILLGYSLVNAHELGRPSAKPLTLRETVLAIRRLVVEGKLELLDELYFDKDPTGLDAVPYARYYAQLDCELKNIGE